MILDDHEVDVYDNDEETYDRYTIMIDSDLNNCYGMSDDPFHPMGFSQYVGRVEQAFLDTQIKLSVIPESIVQAIKQRFE